MKRDPRTIIITMWRCLKLRCPACGRVSIVARPFNIKDGCTACDVIFNREAGFFVGAILINVVITEALIVLVYLACLLSGNFHERITITVLLAVGVSFPLAFYHHSWSFWLGFDHLIESLPRAVKRPPK
jgi:uncharacterized protein (DUF983 family)